MEVNSLFSFTFILFLCFNCSSRVTNYINCFGNNVKTLIGIFPNEFDRDYFQLHKILFLVTCDICSHFKNDHCSLLQYYILVHHNQQSTNIIQLLFFYFQFSIIHILIICSNICCRSLI